MSTEHFLNVPITHLRELYAKHRTELPAELKLPPISAPWDREIAGADRKLAMVALECAVLLVAKRGLRSGSECIDQSLSYQQRSTNPERPSDS